MNTNEYVSDDKNSNRSHKDNDGRTYMTNYYNFNDNNDDNDMNYSHYRNDNTIMMMMIF
jgi:uncharacterized membrane protein